MNTLGIGSRVYLIFISMIYYFRDTIVRVHTLLHKVGCDFGHAFDIIDYYTD